MFNLPVRALISDFNGHLFERRFQRIHVIQLWLSRIGTIACAVICEFLAAMTLLFAWQLRLHATWFVILLTTTALIMIIVALYYYIKSPHNKLYYSNIANVLREHARKAEATPALIQPEALTSTEVDDESLHIYPINRMFVSGISTDFLIFTIIGLLIALVIMLFLLVYQLIDPAGAKKIAIDALVGMSAYMAILGFIQNSNVSFVRYRNVRVNASGITFHHQHRLRFIAWSDIDTFFKMTVDSYAGIAASDKQENYTVYVIDTRDQLFLWSISDKASRREFMAAEALVRYVFTKTQLPLLDESPLAAELNLYGRSLGSRIGRFRQPWDFRRTFTYGNNALLGVTVRTRRVALQQYQKYIPLLVELVIIQCLFIGVAIRLDQAESNYSTLVFTRITKSQPVYTLAMQHNDGYWPNDPRNGYEFTPRGYHVQGSPGQEDVVISPHLAIQDGAVTGSIGQDGYPLTGADEIGIAFAQQQGSGEFLVFSLGAGSTWHLHYNQVTKHTRIEIAAGTSQAILTDSRAYNTLQVTELNGTIQLSINDHVVLHYTQAFWQFWQYLPTTGEVGIYIRSQHPAYFTDFRIYLPPPRPAIVAALLNG